VKQRLSQYRVFLNSVNDFPKERTKLSLTADLDVRLHQNLKKTPKKRDLWCGMINIYTQNDYRITEYQYRDFAGKFGYE
jgi:hypothetical protein